MNRMVIGLLTIIIAGAVGQYTMYDINANLDNSIFRTTARARTRSRTRRDKSNLLAINE